MKKIKKIFQKLNNNGSSLVMVIVALAFIGIIVGALLTAVGYSYRLKLQDLNSRDNFYYVEQAMNEVYAGVGSEVVGDMQDAYAYTVENMVEYDFVTKAYVTKSDDEIQKKFAEKFMFSVQNNPKFTDADIADTVESYITNDSVKLDRSKIYVDEVYENGKLVKIIIKNVTLTRTQNYSKNVASGTYTQTISTDIEIGEPDFNVLFNSTNEDYANIFKYSMVADMGVEVSQPSTSLTIAGNIYAASDYYNKKYNESTYKTEVVNNVETYTVSDTDKKFNSGVNYIITEKDESGNTVQVDKTMDVYTHGSVTSKKYSSNLSANTYYNKYSTSVSPAVAGSNDYFDGVLERSMYSGLFVEGTDVTVMADMVIIPGSVAVMDEGSFSLYGKNGSVTAKAELWADNIVLGGSSDKTINEENDKPVYSGSSAVFKADVYVKDDTELNASGSKLSLNGSYFGYGDSTERDARVFVPTVDEDNFTIKYETTNEQGTKVVETDNRGHYNSSAIIVNGQQSTLNLERTETIYLAGRSYIELSKDVTTEETTVDGKTSVSETYAFMPETNNFLTITDPDDTEYLRDYKTGESISLKTNQLAYIPIMFNGMPVAKTNDAGEFMGYFEAELHVGLRDSALFEKYFPKAVFKDYKIPCVMQEVSGRKYYYYDFETAYTFMKTYNNAQGNNDAFKTAYPSAQYYAAAFIADYVAELKNENSVIAEYLTDIGNFEDLEFDAGDIILPDTNNTVNPAKVYSSGTITSKNGTEFNIEHSANWNQAELASLLLSTNNGGYNNGLGMSESQSAMDDATYYNSAYALSNDLELEYNLVKWNLGHYAVNSADTNSNLRNTKEIEYIKKLVEDASYGEASITPINKFLNMDKIDSSTNISPSSLNLPSGYSVWVSYNDVTVTADSTGIVRGIIVTKGDVTFDNSVTSFEGLIVSGGKVYIVGNLTNMYSSPAICQAVLRECQLLGTTEAKTVLNLFKGYEVDDNAAGGNTPVASPLDPSNGAKTIDSIDYSDVCRFSNWMKNVE